MCPNRIKSGLDMKGSGSGRGVGMWGGGGVNGLVLVYSSHKAD